MRITIKPRSAEAPALAEHILAGLACNNNPTTVQPPPNGDSQKVKKMKVQKAYTSWVKR
mgnify:CR=1 FL=1